jgi:uncharacterized protein (TIRG00374 family)
MKLKLSSILTLVFIAAFIIYFLANPGLLSPLRDVSIGILILIGVTKMSLHVVNGLFMQWSVEVFTKRMRLSEGVYVAVLSAIGNFFGPLLGGATIRAVYLKKVHNLSYSFFTSTLAGYYVILFAANSVLAILSLLFLRNNEHTKGLFVFFAAWLAIMIVLMFMRLPRREKVSRLERNRVSKFIATALYDMESGWRRLIRDRKLVPKLFFLACCGFAITFITGYLEFGAIGASISIAGLGLFTAVSTSSMLVSLTPGAIGIRESLLLLTSSAMGVTTDQILQVAVIDRAVSFAVLGFLYLLTHFLKPKSMKDVVKS